MRIIALCCLGLLFQSAFAQDPVRVIVAHPITHEASHVEYKGKLEPARALELRTPVSSKIAKVFVQPADRVKSGESILELDPDPIEARLKQWDLAVEKARAEVSLAQKQLAAAEQYAKQDAKALAELRAEELRKFQDAGARARNACQKLALNNAYWRSQGEFRKARETLDQTLALFKSRPAGSDPFAQGQQLLQALNKVPTTPVPLDKDCAAELSVLRDILDRLLLLCRAGTPQGREALKAEIAVAETVLKTSAEGRQQIRQTLTLTKITAPIDGLVKQIVKVGDAVEAGERSATLLATIIQVKTVRAIFTVDESCYLKYQELVKSKDRPDVPIALGFKDDKGFPFPGKIEFIDNHGDLKKDVAEVRAVFDNVKGSLTEALLASDKDRRLVRVQITLRDPQKVVLVPWQIVLTNAEGGKQVLVVKDGKLEIRNVKLAGQLGGMQMISEGLTADDLVILGSSRRNFKDLTISPEDFAIDVRSFRSRAGSPVESVLVVLPRLAK